MTLVTPGDILEYWFGEGFDDKNALNSVEYIHSRMPLWFGRASPAFDQTQNENSHLIEELYRFADSNGDGSWSSLQGLLATIIVLDQFSRSVYRGTARAFAADSVVLSSALKLLKLSNISIDMPFAPINFSECAFAGYTSLPVIARFFIIVAIQHSESLAAQQLGVWLASTMAADTSEEVAAYFKNLKGFPLEHHDVIARFGRFPSRNDALGRESTPDEITWLSSPDCPAWARSQRKDVDSK